MHEKYDFSPHLQTRVGENIVYVRAVTVSDLPDEIRAQIGDLETVYAVHAANGDRLALVSDRKMAFVLARQHDLRPVAVN